MGFIRNQQIQIAMRLLNWKYQKDGLPVPPPAQLKQQAATVVDEAVRIAKHRGQNIAAIIKDVIGDFPRR
ncbi:MAG: hypothetical protein ABIL58_04345 [Pseudomonadota bacterium]